MSAVIQALKLVPRNALSRAVGVVLRTPLPRPVVTAGIKGFSRLYGVETGESERPLDDYRTFNDFFTRRLKAGSRSIDGGAAVAVSPVDGTYGQSGVIEDGTLVQAKGRHYTLREFLVDEADARDYDGGTFVTIYLAPYNYHRIHTPFTGRVTGYGYVPGHLWPVNAAGVAKIDKLFAVNERLITHMETRAGKVAIAKVGATCVGRIRATYDNVVTNDGGPREFKRVRYPQGYAVDKAGECGIFEMGSTVVLLFQKGRVELAASVVPGNVVRLGEKLADLTLD